MRPYAAYGLSSLLIVTGLAIQVANIATGCQHAPQCPTCAPAPPPQIVTHRERCMGPPPELPLVVLPAPDAAGTVTLDRKTLAGLLQVLGLLRAYLDTQYERCGLPGGADAGPPPR